VPKAYFLDDVLLVRRLQCENSSSRTSLSVLQNFSEVPSVPQEMIYL